MIKNIYLILFFIAPVISFAQPTVTNCEQFTIGTELRFQKCNIGPSAGAPGGGQTWDFSTLVPLSDTAIEWMVAPSSTSQGSLFPTATFVEKYSDGTFVYVHANADSSYLVGYADTINGYTTYYQQPILFSFRPITFNQMSVAPFTDNLVSATYNQHGSGTATIEADGFGTLLLPTGVHNNVLRLKITQLSSDTATPSGIVTPSTSVSWVWFDGVHTSGLLKIDSTRSGTYVSQSVEYLIDEVTTGIADVQPAMSFRCYPNPANAEIHVSTMSDGVLSISDALGREVQSIDIHDRELLIPTGHLKQGLYVLGFRSGGVVQTSKLVVE